MAYEFATYEKKGRIAIVTVNRPERMNALHPAANFELHEIWNDFERDPDVWVGILTGAGDKAFSASPTAPRAGSRSSRRSTATRSAAGSRWRWPATSSSPPIMRASGFRSLASA
jgi:enoyl-CoA hydratase/carnithine racemase